MREQIRALIYFLTLWGAKMHKVKIIRSKYLLRVTNIANRKNINNTTIKN